MNAPPLLKQCYHVLDLPLNASPRRIKEQYRRLAKQYHPDRTTDPAAKARSTEKFREINRAYQALSEIVQRAKLSPRERKLDYLYQQGCQLLQQKQWSKALVVFNEILGIDPAYRDTLTWLREARRKHKQLASLYAEADSLLRQQQWAEAMSRFANVLHEDPHYRDAVKKFKKARRERLMENFLKQR